MKSLTESFKKNFSKELPIELKEDYPTHIPVGIMIKMVYDASKKAGIESYMVLKHFQFTEEEMRDYLERPKKARTPKQHRKGKT